MWSFLHTLSAPKNFYHWAGKILPIFWILTILLLSYGLIDGLFIAPADYQQGDGFRIIYIHVPSAVMSLMIYMIMVVAAAIYLIWRIKLADVIAKVSGPLGASFTLIALLTGSLWGKPMWGTYWIWDARLTSELILLFLYVGVIALRSAIPELDKAAKSSSILLLVGAVDIPIIHYSVNWWNTLHQSATLLQFAKPTIAPDMLYPLLAMLGAFFCYYLAVMLMRARCELLVRERKSSWVKKLISYRNWEIKNDNN